MAKDPRGKYRISVLRREKKHREELLSETGNTIFEALERLHDKSCETVHIHTSTHGYDVLGRSKRRLHRKRNRDSDDSDDSGSDFSDDSLVSSVASLSDTASVSGSGKKKNDDDDDDDDKLSVVSSPKKSSRRRPSRRSNNKPRRKSRSGSPTASDDSDSDGSAQARRRRRNASPIRLPMGPLARPGGGAPPLPLACWGPPPPPAAAAGLPSVGPRFPPHLASFKAPIPMGGAGGGQPTPPASLPTSPPIPSAPAAPVGPAAAQGSPRDVRLRIIMPGHADVRVLERSAPSRRALTEATLAYVRGHPASFSLGAIRGVPLRATLRRAWFGNESYDMTAYANDDLSRLFDAVGGEKDIPLLEIEVAASPPPGVRPPPPPGMAAFVLN